MKSTCKYVYSFLLTLTCATAAQAQSSQNLHCPRGEILVCQPNACPHGSIGCQENPPPPTCFCADQPIDDQSSLLETSSVDTDLNPSPQH